MFCSQHLPFFHEAITSVNLPNLHWFFGVNGKRPANPYSEVLVSLPKLESVVVSMHNAGFMDSCFGERQMIDIERLDSMRSRARKVLPLNTVVAKYGFETLFECQRLRRLRLEHVKCARILNFTVAGDAGQMLGQLVAFLNAGFAQKCMRTRLELVKVDRA